MPAEEEASIVLTVPLLPVLVDPLVTPGVSVACALLAPCQLVRGELSYIRMPAH